MLRRLFAWTLLTSCVPGVFGAGVTLVTHGQNGVVSEWVIPMTDCVPLRPELPGTNYSAYTISVTQSGSSYVVTPTLRAGSLPTLTDSGEITIALDWSSLATSYFGPSTATIAAQISAALLSTNLIPALGGRALAEFPLHLIGHSRGASLVTDMARLLGAQGVWVDQVSCLDSYPSSLAGDPSMKLYANVLYADSYYQNTDLFNGQFVPGAYNRLLPNLAGGYPSGGNHSDVHLWYHGTIDLRTPTGHDPRFITSTERATWYAPGEARGTNTGFALSLLAAGNRLASVDPAGTATNLIRHGMNQRWEFGAGTINNRTALPANNGAWPNPITLTFASTNAVSAGQSVLFQLACQTGTNTSTEVALHLDNNGNPWDGSVQIGSWLVPATGVANINTLSLTQAVSGALSPGRYRVFARMTAAGRTRYLPATLPLVVQSAPNPAPPTLANPVWTTGQFHLTVFAAVGQTVVIQGSTNLLTWSDLATNQMTSTVWPAQFTSPFPARFFRARLQ